MISWNQSLPKHLLIPYDGVKLTSRPSPVLARSLMDTKSEELLYVLLPHSARLAMLEYHLASNDAPIPETNDIVDKVGADDAANPTGTIPKRPISDHLSATRPS